MILLALLAGVAFGWFSFVLIIRHESVKRAMVLTILRRSMERAPLDVAETNHGHLKWLLDKWLNARPDRPRRRPRA